MPVFEYRGLDGGGKAVSGIVDADTAKVARLRLRKQGLFPTDIRAQQEGAARRGQSILDTQIDVEKYFQFITSRNVSVMTTQLSTLIGAHVPMAEALNALVDQTEKSKLKVILSRVKERVNEGAGLAEAMADHPRVFDDLYVQMVRAGERSGALPEVLKRLAAYADSQVKLQGQIISAVAYPILLGMVGTLMLGGIFTFVIPRVRGLFEAMPGGLAALPIVSRMVFFAGDFLVSAWWLFPLVLVGLVVGFRAWVRSTTGRARWDKFQLRVPLFGKLNRLVAVSRFCRTFATLLVSGVPIVNALQIVQAVVGNTVISDVVGRATVNIQEGQSIAVPLKQSGEFPPLVTHMIWIGEKTGELERMLTVVADTYEDQVEATISALTTMLGPAMILMIGGIVFVVAWGLLTPMMNISSLVR